MRRVDRRRFLQSTGWAAGLCGAGLFGSGGSLFAQTESPEFAFELMTPPAQKAIAAGLSYLARRQQNDGSIGSGNYTRNVAVCGLTGLAFMANGSTPNRGPFGEHVEKCVSYLLECTRDDGFVVYAPSTGHGPMYGHGFATLFLAECYGMTMRADIGEKLQKAVQLIVDTQNDEGGWRYQPKRSDADLSVTICQVMALRAARNAGIFVPKDTIDRCTDYCKRAQNADGGFMYQLNSGNARSEFARSAAGVVALYMAGVYDGPEVKRGLDYLMNFLPQGEAQFGISHYFYGHYYAVQAMWRAGGHYWESWYPAIRDELNAIQQSDGSWHDNICNEYATAMSCIVLQVPNNFLPILQL